MSFRYIVIDDTAFVSEIIKNLLKNSGANCVGQAWDGEEGYRLFEKTLPDLVLLDMVMPKENGIELARRIREISRDVVIIACSTLDDKTIIENAIDLGCNDYIVKPFTKEGFLEVLKRHFKFELEKIK
ncbi:MAG TPA: response regulator [Pseudobdellovibrionaceae bacterium]|jgi:YesN/AraC family two-component response regulator